MRRTFYGLSALSAIVLLCSPAKADGYLLEPPRAQPRHHAPLPPLPPRGVVQTGPTNIIINNYVNVQVRAPIAAPAPVQEIVEEDVYEAPVVYGRPAGCCYGGARYVGHRPGFYQGDPAGTYVGRKYVPFGGSYGTPPYPRSSTDVYGYGYYLRQNSRGPGY